MLKIWSQDEEAQHLEARFKELKKLTGVSQAKFAEANKVPGGKSFLNQHIKNHRPMNLDAAKAYAKGFGCDISEISPRLAAELEAARAVWAPKEQQEYIKVTADDLEMATTPVPGYTREALALAWLLDQVQDKLDKKKAEVDASAAILRYVNKPYLPPTDMPDEH